MRKTLLATCSLILTLNICWSQTSTSPFIFNSAGGTYNPPNNYYQYEWSIGELALINTMTTADSSCRLLNGVLQPGTEHPFYPNTLLFEAGDYTIFPNPTPGRFELNFFITTPGKMDLMLTDATGRMLEQRSYQYDGVRRIELFDLSRYTSGVYFVIAMLVPNSSSRLDNMRVVRRNALKVLKVN